MKNNVESRVNLYLLSNNIKNLGVWQNVCVADTGTEKAQHKVMGHLGSINESECFQRINRDNK